MHIGTCYTHELRTNAMNQTWSSRSRAALKILTHVSVFNYNRCHCYAMVGGLSSFGWQSSCVGYFILCGQTMHILFQTVALNRF